MIARPRDLPTTDRPLTLVRRRDIEAESLIVRDRRWWRLKDPVALRFWQLGDEEHFLWSQLDKGTSLAELQQRFAQRFGPQRIEIPHLHQFLGALHREGLIFSTAEGQGETLLERHKQQLSRNRFGWTNLLALRFRGIAPTWLLDLLYPRLAWLFRPWVLFALAFLVLSSLLLAVTELDLLRARLPHAASFLTPSSLGWMALTLAAVKICHELGHALVCRHLGGRCHELGVMLLVFTPCLYCNVSDAWLMPSRWRRMAISAAGIGVELVLAAMATWLWWFSESGIISTLCLNVMVICSVNTVLFNGNPLLRYDGYFLLSDFLDLPNLRQAGDEWLNRLIDRTFFGIESPQVQPALRDDPGIVGAYGLASFIYRWSLTVMIWWFIYEWFREWRLLSIGIAIIVFSAMMILAQSTSSGCKRFFAAWHDRRVHMGRATISLIATLALLVAVALIPFPRNLISPATIRPAAAETVYVTLPGTSLQVASVGKQVEVGEIIAQLANDELQQEILRLTGETQTLQRQVERLRKRQVQETSSGIASAAGQLPTMEQQLASVSSRLAQKQSDSEQLTLRAPRAGTILSVRSKLRVDADSLDSWDGNPLEPRNVGCFLEAGTPLCQVGSLDQMEALVIVEQSQVDAVEIGQAVQVQLDELPHANLHGTVREIAELRSEAAPAELIAKQQLPTARNTSEPVLVGTYYQVTVSLEVGPPIPFGSSGNAKIRVAPQTLLRRAYDAICATFRW